MKTNKVLRLFAIVLFFNCSANDDESALTLPPITQTGENIIGCFVDGKHLVPRDGSGTFNLPDKGMRIHAGGIPPEITYWEIRVNDFKSEHGSLLTLHIEELDQIGEGEYIINESNCQNGIDSFQNVNISCRLWDNISKTYNWYCSIESEGTLIITRYDIENHIVSGILNCTAVNRDNANDVIEITEGRFDINWDTLYSTTFN